MKPGRRQTLLFAGVLFHCLCSAYGSDLFGGGTQLAETQRRRPKARRQVAYQRPSELVSEDRRFRVLPEIHRGSFHTLVGGHLEYRASGSVTLGAAPAFTLAAHGGATLVGMGLLANAQWYPAGAWNGLWLRGVIGVLGLYLSGPGFSEGNWAPVAGTLIGYRIPFSPSFSLGVGAGALYFFHPQFDAATLAFRGAQPSLLIDASF